MTEVAPRLFEVALHYTRAISAGAFGQVMLHDRAAGVPVHTVGGSELPPGARGAIEELVGRELTVLNARARTATLRCPRGERERIDTYAVLDAAIGRDAWFAACRVTWPMADFRDNDCAQRHDRIVVAVDDDEHGDVGLYRLSYDDVEGASLRVVVRDALLRSLVLGPAFGSGPRHSGPAGFAGSAPPAGEAGRASGRVTSPSAGRGSRPGR